MKSIVLAMALFLAAVTTQTLTQEERDRAVAELEGSRKAFLDATKGLSPAQSNFKAAPDRWSVAECSEHIALAEGFIFGLVSEKIMKAPANPEKREAAKGKDDLILKIHTETYRADFGSKSRREFPADVADCGRTGLSSRHVEKCIEGTDEIVRPSFCL